MKSKHPPNPTRAADPWLKFNLRAAQGTIHPSLYQHLPASSYMAQLFSPFIHLLTYLLTDSLPAPHIDTAGDGTGQVQALGPRAIFLPGNDLDFAELLAEAHDGVRGLREGELLS